MSETLRSVTAQLATRDSESVLTAVLDATLDALIVMDPSGEILLANRATQRLLGYAPSQLIGRDVTMLMPEDHAAAHDGYVRSYLETGDAKIIGTGRDVVAVSSEGEEVPVWLSVGEARHEDGRWFVGLLSDQRPRKRLERELRRSERDLRRVLDGATAATASIHLDGSFVTLNEALLDLCDARRSWFEGRTLFELTHPDHLPSLESAFERLRSGTGAQTLGEHRIVARDGRQRVVALDLVIVEAHGPGLVVIQAIDRTAERRAQEEVAEQRERLAQVDRLSTLGEMASGIAHEINQPLGAISNYAEACLHQLGKPDADPTKLREALERIGSQAQRAAEVIRRMREFIRGGKVEREPADLSAIAREVVALAEVDARSRDVRILLDLPDEPMWVEVDSVQIQQVILNLLRNAMEALSEHDVATPGVFVVVSREGSECLLEVEDNGPGIAAQQIETLMDPFVTTKAAGLGLGLPISNSIVTNHGGRLWLEDSDSGAHFVVALPSVAESSS